MMEWRKMTILQRLTDDMKSAMKAGEKERLSTIRLLRGQLKDAMIDKREELTEDEEIAVLANAAKKKGANPLKPILKRSVKISLMWNGVSSMWYSFTYRSRWIPPR